LLALFFNREDEGDMFSANFQWTTQKMELFITTAVRTSNPASTLDKKKFRTLILLKARM
jgi:hypothetical protein